MSEKLKVIYEKYKEIILYLIFGVLTTLVGWVTYFVILIPGKAVFGIPVDDTSSAGFMAIYTAAQIIQWVAAVLFAFFTNRKYVFNAEGNNSSTLKQLAVFSSGRVVTFFIDYLVTLLGAKGLSALFPALSSAVLLGRAWNLNEIFAKVVAAVIVIVANYFFSKFLVFRNKTK